MWTATIACSCFSISVCTHTSPPNLIHDHVTVDPVWTHPKSGLSRLETPCCLRHEGLSAWIADAVALKKPVPFWCPLPNLFARSFGFPLFPSQIANPTFIGCSSQVWEYSECCYILQNSIEPLHIYGGCIQCNTCIHMEAHVYSCLSLKVTCMYLCVFHA